MRRVMLALVLIVSCAVAAATGAGSTALMAAPSVREIGDTLLLAASPEQFRQTRFLRFSDDAGREVYLLGTIHGRHLTTPGYSLLHLQAVQAHLKPDLLLVESRPEELSQDNWADGPIEMVFDSLIARANRVEVEGFDWWSMNETHQITGDEREDHMFGNIRGHLAQGQRTLILTGYGHVAGFERRLRASGFRPRAFAAAEKQRLFDTRDQRLRFPGGMTRYVRKRIEIDRATLRQQTDGFWRDRLAAAIAERRTLLATIASVGEQAP